MKIHEAAIQILRREGTPLHILKLVEKIANDDLLGFDEKNIETELDSALSSRSINIVISKNYGNVLFYKAAPATYGLLEFLEENPGRGVYEVIKMLFNDSEEPLDSLLFRVDNALRSEGMLIRSMRNSILFYMTRRLITFAVYRKRFYKKNGIEEATPMRKDLNDFLQDQTRIDERYHGLLVELLRSASENRTRKIPKGLRKQLLKDARQNDLKCYLCGIDLDYENEKRDNSVQIEHVWPRALGGPSNASNLKVACSQCNKDKASHMDSSDLHFERICFVTDESENNFLKELNHYDKLTLLTKNESKCSICGESAETVGQLYVNRSNEDDVMHYFNVINTCSEHGGERW